MKKNFKLPILLLAVVVMLSIFYIKEANEVNDNAPVDSDNLNVSTLNPDFTEARIQSINEINALIDEYETQIASGDLTASEVTNTTILIDELIGKKNNEIALEEEILTLYNTYDDVLVLVNDNVINVSIYNDEEISSEAFIAMCKLSYEKFSMEYKVVANLVSSTD